MNYSFFLFTKLYDAYINVQYEYDYMFGDLQSLYEEYEQSSFNNENEGEYTCMENFLMSNKDAIIKRFENNAETTYFVNRPELNP